MAKIKVDPERKIGELDRRVFGGFIEHLGRCIYGGVFDEGSPLSDEHGYRRDVLEAAKELRMPLLRWPGGNFVSGYHWTDGIGPREERPRKTELAWFSEESNRFGTDEFMEYCRLLGTEPYICVNMGTGTLDEAQGWVEYCNFARNCEIANLAQMANVIAPIVTGEEGMFLQTIYHPIKLCAEHMGEVVLDAHVDCETHDLTGEEASSWPHRVADMGPFDLLDVSATCDALGRDLTLVVVNRDPGREIETTIQLTDAAFDGTATAHEVTGPHPKAINSFEEQPVGVSERPLEASGSSFEHRFPPCSITVLRLGISG